VLELSLREALRLGHRRIASEHILLAVIREGQGLAARIMSDAGVDLAAMRRAAEASLRQAA
jgi:ATP-dependent Clp protease ATP-binding subunit ClpA